MPYLGIILLLSVDKISGNLLVWAPAILVQNHRISVSFMDEP
jgi:hypothetical protein